MCGISANPTREPEMPDWGGGHVFREGEQIRGDVVTEKSELSRKGK